MKTYNELVGSLEGNVMPKGRRFRDLGAAANGSEIKPLSEIETSARMLRIGRDMQLDVVDADGDTELAE